MQWGCVPITFHSDGAEFFRNSEYFVWSISSLLASGDEPLLQHERSCEMFVCLWNLVKIHVTLNHPKKQWVELRWWTLSSPFAFCRTKVWKTQTLLGNSSNKLYLVPPNTVTILLRWIGITPLDCSEVQNAVHKRVADLFSWSMGYAAEGIWPMTGVDGEILDPKSLRFEKRGQSLAGGWRQGSTFKCPMVNLQLLVDKMAPIT